MSASDKPTTGAGAEFDSPQEAAIDFANNYNDDSISNDREYGTVIYSYYNDSGDKKYSYNVPNEGTSNGVNIDLTVSEYQTIESAVHTHGAAGNDLFGISTEFVSDTDRRNMLTNNNEYLVAPSGTVYEYGKNPQNDKAIYSNAPSDNYCAWHNENTNWEYIPSTHK